MQTQIATILREAADRIASIVPTPTVPAPLKLEAGKKYTRRDGQIVGPLEAYSWHATATYAFHFHGDAWTANGEWFVGSTNYRDLVSEYVEPEPAPEPEQPRFKVGDTVRVVSLEKTEPRFGRISRRHKPGDTFVIQMAWTGDGVVDKDGNVYAIEDLVPSKPTPNQEQVDELVAAASVTLDFLRGVRFPDGRLALALAPFAK